MARPKIDRDKLRAQLRRLRKDALLEILDSAVDLVPASRLAGLVEGHVDLSTLAPEGRRAGALLRAVRTFCESSLRGDYHEAFNVDSKNFTRMSKGTRTWIAECERFFESCVDAARTQQRRDEARQALEVLFDLLKHVDECHDDVVFFASEGGIIRGWRRRHRRRRRLWQEVQQRGLARPDDASASP